MCKVAILIPTINRKEFVIRQLRYYASVSSTHPVYIGDGSAVSAANEIQAALDSCGSKLQVYYHHLPGLNDRQTIVRLGELANETYCAFKGDDDYLIPGSLSKCADFLHHNPSYRTAQGKAILFQLNEPGPYGTLKGSHYFFLQLQRPVFAQKTLNTAGNRILIRSRPGKEIAIFEIVARLLRFGCD